MRISVNLATRPFVELRPFFLRLRILMGVLAVAAVALFVVIHIQTKQLRKAQSEMDTLVAETTKVQQEKKTNENRMRRPPNSGVLDRAHFLNRLFLIKSFSWTAVMMDLENVLPTGVQVTSIEPQPTLEGDVVIRLRVAGDRDRAVQLVRNLEHSHRFLQPRLIGEVAQAKEGANGGPINPALLGAVEFDILANYNPLPEGEAYRFAKPKVEAVAAPKAVSGPLPGVVLKPYVAPKPAAAVPAAKPAAAPVQQNANPQQPPQRVMPPFMKRRFGPQGQPPPPGGSR